MSAQPPKAPTVDAARSCLVAALLDPLVPASLSEDGWSALLASARRANLIGALAVRLQAAGVVAPAPAQRHLAGAVQLATRQRLSVQWEAQRLQAVMGPLGVPVLLLKGAAYVMAPAEPPLGEGRTFGDIDVLVPRSALGDVESALMLDGWVSAHADPYDQRYYRQWMHEIPPMQHVHRNTVIDVHHNILPLTARNAPDPAQIIDRAVPLPGLSALRIPAPEDLVVHSITHLVHEGELHNGLRDLYDIHSMLQRFGRDPDFWPRLVTGGAGNDLAGPLLLGLKLVETTFGTHVPPEVLSPLRAAAAPAWRRPWLLGIYTRALRLESERGASSSVAAARFLIYLRSHALRMPPTLLARHLGIKAWKSMCPRRQPTTA